MVSIKTGFIPPETLSNLRNNKQAATAIKKAAEQEGSEIVFKDKNNQVQTVKLDEYLNNPELSKFKGAKSATLTLDVGQGTTLLLDVQELSQENLLKAVSAALTKIEAKGSSSHVSRFKAGAASIFDSIKPTPKAEPKGIDESTRQSLRKQPVAKTIDSSTSNFLDIINPLDSPGDSVDIRLEASAAVKLWGPLGIEASGGAGINISVDDDGLYYLKFNVNADAGVVAKGKIKGQEVKGKAALGRSVGVVYRFKNASQVNQFLLQKFNDALPTTLRKEFFPKLEKNTEDVKVKPTTIDTTYWKVEGEVKLGKIKLQASYESRDIERSFFKPDGSLEVSQDFSKSAQVGVDLGNGVGISGTYSHFRVEKDNIPENTGTYNAIEGTLTFTLPKGKGADHIREHIENAANKLGFTGDTKAKFIQGVLARADSKIKALDAQRDQKPTITLGIAIHAQWEDTDDGGSGELQFLRVGTVASVEVEKEFSIGVVEASIKGVASATDLTDVVVGTKDETYLKGLYFNNPKQYAIAKSKAGGDDALVGPKGKEKTLAQWEKEWKVETRPEQEVVTSSTNVLGKKEKAYQFFVDHFKALDLNNDGYIYTNELEDALKHQAFQGEDAKAALQYLLDNIATLEEYSNDETGDENDGITLADIKLFIQNARD